MFQESDVALQPGLYSNNGTFEYVEFDVPDELSWLVERFYFLHTDRSCAAAFQVVADGRSDLMFDCRGEHDPMVTLSLARPLHFDLPASLRMVGARLRPGRLGQLAGSVDVARDGSSHRVADLMAVDQGIDFRRRADPEVILGEVADRLFRPEPEEDIDLMSVQSVIQPRRNHLQEHSPLTTPPGMSDRHFRRLFARRFGLSPKRFQRVQRFQESLQSLAADPAHSLSDLASAHGYFDQAHMTNEWLALSGQRPSWWRGRFFQDGLSV